MDQLNELCARLQRQDVAWRTTVARERLAALETRIARAQRQHLRGCRERESGIARQLAALSPLAVLSRGYALVYDETGALLKTTESIREGQSTVTRLSRGRLRSRVSHIEEDSKKP
jgi:exodeoxyribonuclease VII large subunit